MSSRDDIIESEVNRHNEGDSQQIDEDRVAEVVEMEAELAQMRHDAELDADDSTPLFSRLSAPFHDVSLHEYDPRTSITGTVTGLNRKDTYAESYVQLIVSVGEETHRFDMEWPKNESDIDEGLDIISLLKQKNIPVGRLANLRGETVHVLPDGEGGYNLVVPQNNLLSRGIHTTLLPLYIGSRQSAPGHRARG